MSLPINATNVVIVPFPPSISVDEIIQMHLKNGIKNVNETMNAFMIYRNEFNHIHQNFNLSCKNVSKLASKSWKNESEYVKDYYKQISKEVKKRFKEIVPTPCFINKFGTSNQVDTNNVSLETNPPMDKNSPDTIYSSHQFVNMGPMNQISPEITCQNSLLMNTEQNSLGYNSPPSNSPDAIYSSHPDATYSNSPVEQYPLEITFIDTSKMDQISPSINYTTYVNSPPSNSLSTIYSGHQFMNMGQNSPDITYSNLPVDQYPLEFTFPDPSNIDQISPAIGCYNSLLTNAEKNSPDTISYNSTFLSIDR
ncbi:10289_t:CDS:2 [Diversispora eburnea]|uniref:10289_t:CDS:1 n=1 Tax=Diversispora eburnea TaxID=1213867 RepID=A0A9N9C1H7_9GLOM|nr:10289_t:CDS:2 [Diversispora eburnea]